MTAHPLRRLLSGVALLLALPGAVAGADGATAATAGAPATAAAATAGTAATAEDLAFLAGSWRMAGPPAIEEHWMQPAGGTLIGMGRVSSEGRTFFFEYLRIETRADGLYYVAQPKGGPPTGFKLVKLGPAEAVFENLGHDFPKRIIYRRLDDGRLFARTEGDGTEKEKASEFLYGPVER